MALPHYPNSIPLELSQGILMFLSDWSRLIFWVIRVIWMIERLFSREILLDTGCESLFQYRNYRFRSLYSCPDWLCKLSCPKSAPLEKLSTCDVPQSYLIYTKIVSPIRGIWALFHTENLYKYFGILPSNSLLVFIDGVVFWKASKLKSRQRI